MLEENKEKRTNATTSGSGLVSACVMKRSCALLVKRKRVFRKYDKVKLPLEAKYLEELVMFKLTTTKSMKQV